MEFNIIKNNNILDNFDNLDPLDKCILIINVQDASVTNDREILDKYPIFGDCVNKLDFWIYNYIVDLDNRDKITFKKILKREDLKKYPEFRKYFRSERILSLINDL